MNIILCRSLIFRTITYASRSILLLLLSGSIIVISNEMSLSVLIWICFLGTNSFVSLFDLLFYLLSSPILLLIMIDKLCLWVILYLLIFLIVLTNVPPFIIIELYFLSICLINLSVIWIMICVYVANFEEKSWVFFFMFFINIVKSFHSLQLITQIDCKLV